MKHLRIVFGLAAVAGLMAVMAGPTLAAQTSWGQCKENKEHGEWGNSLCTEAKTKGNWETKEVTETIEVTSSSSLELEDQKATGGAVAVKCGGTDLGTIGAKGSDEISKIATSSCEFVGEKHGSCEEASGATAEAINLPWVTKLEENTEGEVRDVIESAVSGKTPGWSVKCTVSGILKVTDECTGITNTGIRDTPAGTVEAEFEEISAEAPVTCSIGGKGAGFVHGDDTIKAKNGGAIFVNNVERAWYVEANKLKAEEKLKTTATLPTFNLFSKKLGVLVTCKKITLSATSAILPEIEMHIPALELRECAGDFMEPGCALEETKITTTAWEGFLENGRFIKFETTAGAEKLAGFKVVKVGAERCAEVGEWTVNGALLAKLRQPEAEVKARKLAFERAANSSLLMHSPKTEDKKSVFLEAVIEGLEVASGKTWSAKRP
jgi:hypothetical protein